MNINVPTPTWKQSLSKLILGVFLAFCAYNKTTDA